MGYPPPPPPPGSPGGYGPPSGPGYGPPPGAPPPPPGAPGYGTPPPGGYGGLPPGYGGPPPPGAPGGPPPGGGTSGSSKGPLIALMTALVVVVLLAVVGGLILLSRDSDDDVELTEAQRTDALLTEGDVGEGYVEEPEDDESSDDDVEASGECEDTIDELEAEGTGPFSDEEPAGSVSRQFEDETNSAIDHGIAPSIDIVTLYERLLDGCDEVMFSDSSGSGTFTFDEGDTIEVGDESIAVDISVSFESDGLSFEVEGAIVAWTRDGNDSVISYLGGIDEETFEGIPIDRGLLEDLATTADDKLAEVIDEA